MGATRLAERLTLRPCDRCVKHCRGLAPGYIGVEDREGGAATAAARFLRKNQSGQVVTVNFHVVEYVPCGRRFAYRIVWRPFALTRTIAHSRRSTVLPFAAGKLGIQ